MKRFLSLGNIPRSTTVIHSNNYKPSFWMNNIFLSKQNARAQKTFSLNPVKVPSERMRSLDDWSQQGSFELMFATKPGLPIPYFPINHSAIALRNHEDSTFSVYGRQSPWDYSKWFRDGIKLGTKKDNERKYLTEGYNFIAYPTGAFFNQAEITHFLDSADKLINEKQICNMYNSNCYSYSITAMAFAIETMLSRPQLDSKAVSRIMTVMEQHPLIDNFSIGVLNNQAVVDKLSSVFASVQQHTASLKNPSPEDQHLHDQASRLLTKLGSNQEYQLDFPQP